MGWPRVKAILDFVHGHLVFDYDRADPTRTAHGGFTDRTGVCRDFAHLTITLCRCLNIPARYCTGYLGDIGVPDEHSGEAVKVFVVKKDPALTEAQVQQWCKDKLTGYKRPRFVEFRDELPKSNVGKILRRELRPDAEAAAGQGQAA